MLANLFDMFVASLVWAYATRCVYFRIRARLLKTHNAADGPFPEERVRAWTLSASIGIGVLLLLIVLGYDMVRDGW